MMFVWHNRNQWKTNYMNAVIFYLMKRDLYTGSTKQSNFSLLFLKHTSHTQKLKDYECFYNANYPNARYNGDARS